MLIEYRWLHNSEPNFSVVASYTYNIIQLFMFGENGGFVSACATCAVLLIMTSRASLDKYSLVLSVQTSPIQENIIRIIDYQPRSIGFNFYDLGTKFIYQICADVLKAPYKMCTLCKTSINFNIWQCTPFYGAHPIQCTLKLLFIGHTLYNVN